ncbi:frataxin, mitochondrial-like [Lytechinus pictus]|uniref:frataxin, mitochondrial-like n=1 Tax=Lytechinus pictus TaxID=7653 RepID=UPI0030BA1229
MFPIMRQFQMSSLSLRQLIYRRVARNTLNQAHLPKASIQQGTSAVNSILPRALGKPTTATIPSHLTKSSADKYIICVRNSSGGNEKAVLSDLEYEKIADQTLDHLSEFFEILGDSENCPSEFDVMYSSGVLTVAFGQEHGTYVINKQTPNKQIWLSSPTSGPKRYDYINKRWIYIHDGMAIHDLLSQEISKILDSPVDVSEAEQWDT